MADAATQTTQGNTTPTTFQQLYALYQSQRTVFVDGESYIDRATQAISGDSRIDLVDKDAAKALSLASSDPTQAVAIIKACLDTLGYVGSLPTLSDEVVAQAKVVADTIASDVSAAASTTWGYGKWVVGALLVGGLIFVAIKLE